MNGYCKEGENHCVCGGDLPQVREGCGNWVKIDPAGPMPVVICGHGGETCNYACHGKAREHCKPVSGTTTITFKDHEQRRLVEELMKVTDMYLNTRQLRERVRGVVKDFIEGKFK
ncbi:hypothetical protein JXVLWARM_CDS_0095 [Burkholderia phage Bm1]